MLRRCVFAGRRSGAAERAERPGEAKADAEVRLLLVAGSNLADWARDPSTLTRRRRSVYNAEMPGRRSDVAEVAAGTPKRVNRY